LHEVFPFTLPHRPTRIRPREGHMKTITDSKMIIRSGCDFIDIQLPVP
jgi:hypothetical protein